MLESILRAVWLSLACRFTTPLVTILCLLVCPIISCQVGSCSYLWARAADGDRTEISRLVLLHSKTLPVALTGTVQLTISYSTWFL